jgi:3-oxoacyl-[acyl-carrier-protein] synthase-3
MGTATPDMPVADWSLCGYRNRATNAFAFDLQAACSSFLYGMSVAQLMFNLENIKRFY